MVPLSDGHESYRFTPDDFARSASSSAPESRDSTRRSNSSSSNTSNSNRQLTDEAFSPEQDRDVEGLARLINAFNPSIIVSGSDFDPPPGRPCVQQFPEPPQQSRAKKKRRHRTCEQCDATKTPQWRAGPESSSLLCNVCGLVYAKQKERPTPPTS